MKDFIIDDYPRYKKFIDSRRARMLSSSELVEKHHVRPRSLGGSDRLSNIIELSLREHLIAHFLLFRDTAYPSMVYAFSQMIGRAVLNDPGKNMSKRYERYRTYVKRYLSRLQSDSASKLFKTGTIVYRHATHEVLFIKKSDLKRYLDDGWVKNIRPKGSKIMNKDGFCELVFPEDIQRRLDDGYALGYGPNHKIHKALRGMIQIHRGTKQIRIWPEELKIYLNDGWREGQTPAQRKGAARGAKGKHWKKMWIDPMTTEYIDLGQVEEYLARGYHFGVAPNGKGLGYTWHHSEKTKKQESQSHRGIGKGWKKMYRGDDETEVPPEKVDEYVASDWTLGTIKSRHPEGTRRMTNGQINTLAHPAKIPKYLTEGWVYGWAKKGNLSL